jgi:hypothetical protein
MDPSRCRGVDWIEEERAYLQCGESPQFSDGRCYRHSSQPNEELVAFEREMTYLLGPGAPRGADAAQLGRSRIEELSARLAGIVAVTLKDLRSKERWGALLLGALKFIEMRRAARAREAERIPPEFLRRHRESSVNPFEFSLRKCFAILETTPESAREEVVKAWRRLAKRHHPDRTGGDDEVMKALNDAKERIFRLRGWD